MPAPYYSDGSVGEGGFIGAFNLAGNVIVESFTRDRPSSHIIDQPDQYGGPLKWAGVAGFETASALVQLPFNAGVLTQIALGDFFIAPVDHGAGKWVVTSVGETFQIGDYFKANLGLKLTYNT